MYRFNRTDNAAATALFQHAVAKDPGFARAHAGLSFVHFQTAFMRHTDDLPASPTLHVDLRSAAWHSTRSTRS